MQEIWFIFLAYSFQRNFNFKTFWFVLFWYVPSLNQTLFAKYRKLCGLEIMEEFISSPQSFERTKNFLRRKDGQTILCRKWPIQVNLRRLSNLSSKVVPTLFPNLWIPFSFFFSCIKFHICWKTGFPRQTERLCIVPSHQTGGLCIVSSHQTGRLCIASVNYRLYTLDIQKVFSIFICRVWLWLRLNASCMLNTCKSNAFFFREKGVANGWITREILPLWKRIPFRNENECSICREVKGFFLTPPRDEFAAD